MSKPPDPQIIAAMHARLRHDRPAWLTEMLEWLRLHERVKECAVGAFLAEAFQDDPDDLQQAVAIAHDILDGNLFGDSSEQNRIEEVIDGDD